jgi:hypothetical protein
LFGGFHTTGSFLAENAQNEKSEFSGDDFPGLGVKVFLIRQKNHFGAESNQYAPLYLWPSVEPMWKFIAGDGFRGFVDSFGWTPIHYWLGFAYACAGFRPGKNPMLTPGFHS